MTTIDTIVLPGIGGSGPDHWQTHWQTANPSFRRFAPGDWLQPDLEVWVDALERSIRDLPAPPLIIAHSLSCLLVAHSAQRGIGPIRGAFLVAVPDPGTDCFPEAAQSFRAVPEDPLPFPALVVASSDDPYGSLTHAHRCATLWGADFAGIGPCGHINAASNLGAWPDGFSMFQQFRTRISP